MVDIIAIDDDHMMLEHIVTALELKGYAVRGTQRASEGIALIRELQPLLVVCDISMPELSGFEVLDQVRHDPSTADVPFIFVTARSGRESMRRGMELGADDYLSKPFTASELIKAVQAQISKRQKVAERYESTLSRLRKNITYALPHELRTPLAASIGYAQYLQISAHQLTPEQVYVMAEHILKANQRLHRVFENYLVYAQLELLTSDGAKLAAFRSQLTGKVAEIITEEATQSAEEVGRAADLQVQADKIALGVSEENLRKIMAELVSNAFKFSKAGSPVSVTGRRIDTAYVIEIKDAGRGMDADQVAHIGAYMQFERALHEQQGLGLGLAIARRLVELHQGEFKLTSAVNQGTLIELRFAV